MPRLPLPALVATIAALSAILAILLLAYTQPTTARASRRTSDIVEHRAGTYVVREIYNALTPNECASLMAHAKARGLEESMVWDYGNKGGNVLDNGHRRSKQTWLPYADHPAAKKLSDLSTALTGLPPGNQELLQVAMYEPGGRFNDHYDACDYDDPEYCDRMNNGAGERRATLLVYLNDNYTGGSTEFVNTGIEIKPTQGKAILFWNTTDNEGIIRDSKHRGNPVTTGEKWIATVWTHQREYPTTPPTA